MKKVSKVLWQREVGNDKPAMTVGLDLGDRYSHYCVLNEECEVVEEGRIQSTESRVPPVSILRPGIRRTLHRGFPQRAYHCHA